MTPMQTQVEAVLRKHHVHSKSDDKAWWNEDFEEFRDDLCAILPETNPCEHPTMAQPEMTPTSPSVTQQAEQQGLSDPWGAVPGCPHKPRAHICLACYKSVLLATRRAQTEIDAKVADVEADYWQDSDSYSESPTNRWHTALTIARAIRASVAGGS